MDLLLDAHVSGRRVGRALRTVGHDVLALDSHEALSRLPDGEVLALAAKENRVVVTYNVSDFARLAREWAEAGRTHAGLILATDPLAGYGAIRRRLERMFAERPDQDEWIDRVEFLGRG